MYTYISLKQYPIQIPHIINYIPDIFCILYEKISCHRHAYLAITWVDNFVFQKTNIMTYNTEMAYIYIYDQISGQYEHNKNNLII